MNSQQCYFNPKQKIVITTGERPSSIHNSEEGLLKRITKANFSKKYSRIDTLQKIFVDFVIPIAVFSILFVIGANLVFKAILALEK